MLTNTVLRGIKTISNRKTATIKAGIKNQMNQDKYKRTVIRRVIRPRPKQPKAKPAWISGTLPKILTPQNIAPKQTKPLPDIKPIIQSSGITKKDKAQKVGSDLWKWLKENSGIIILNLGSLCTLTAFTRSDILELRCLSMTGSISSVLYFLSLPPPKVWFPAMWSGIFAFTNAYKVYFILEERKGKPKYLSSEELAVYEEYFAPHGMTPRQFEKLIEISTEIKVPKGQVLVENETDLNSVYLVKSGSIDALTGLKRRVTAASTDKSVAMTGGDSGAWIGELAFLDYLAARDTNKSKMQPKSSSNISSGKKAKDDSVGSTSSSNSSSGGGSGLQSIEGTSDQVSNGSNINGHKETTNVVGDHHGRVATKKAIFTYIATEDTTVYSFDHDALCELLESSVELRAALTRAMTAAVVGKVVNMYLSKLDKDKPLWQKWLEDNWQTTTTTAAAATVKEEAPVEPQQENSASNGSTNSSTSDTGSVPLITIKLLKRVQEGP
jgi:cAMP-binding proteins - catabolite gene activator and regulatory subunit of cAMP-dependent protein kinases